MCERTGVRRFCPASGRTLGSRVNIDAMRMLGNLALALRAWAAWVRLRVRARVRCVYV